MLYILTPCPLYTSREGKRAKIYLVFSVHELIIVFVFPLSVLQRGVRGKSHPFGLHIQTMLK